MGWFRGLSGSEVSGDYHPTECDPGTDIVCFEDAIALPATVVILLCTLPVG